MEQRTTAVTEPQSHEAQMYRPDWDSLCNYRAPQWYQDAKFGVWAIWGPYSVPAYRGGHVAGWYGRWMYDVSNHRNSGIYEYHKRTYGHPSRFGYKDFIPMFTGERFDADRWVRLGAEAGAKFFTIISEFHDGFAMYDSSHTPWNSVAMGPRRDVTGEIERAVRRAGLKFGVSNHLGWHYDFYWYNHANKFDAVDPATHGLYTDGTGPSRRFIDGWWKRTCELADKYRPDLYYFDWGWDTSEAFAPWRPKFCEFYYNSAIRWGRGEFGSPGVVINYKHGILADGCAVLDLERAEFDNLRGMIWQNDTSISKKCWCYCNDDVYKTPDEIVDMLVDVVSKNGVLMLAFGPRADGTVPGAVGNVLLEVGGWLKTCGEAIYSTRPYVVYGEGPTVPGGAMHRRREALHFARRPLHPQQGQYGPLRHGAGLAGRVAEYYYAASGRIRRFEYRRGENARRSRAVEMAPGPPGAKNRHAPQAVLWLRVSGENRIRRANPAGEGINESEGVCFFFPSRLRIASRISVRFGFSAHSMVNGNNSGFDTCIPASDFRPSFIVVPVAMFDSDLRLDKRAHHPVAGEHHICNLCAGVISRSTAAVASRATWICDKSGRRLVMRVSPAGSWIFYRAIRPSRLLRRLPRGQRIQPCRFRPGG